MADPISVVSLVEGSIGLVLQCGSVAKTLSDMKAKFKHAEVAIMSLIQEVETIQFAWGRIKEWSEDHAEAATDSQFVQRLEKSLQCGTLVLSALEQDLADYQHSADNASFVLRSKMAWNERAFLDHQHRVRGQVQAMTLMLQVSQLPTSKAQTKLLKKKEKALRVSDESAYSIVPSRMSSHVSVSTRSRNSFSTVESHELVYYPLSFENDLFTARVYKRNYRNPWINSLVKFHRGKKMDERRVPVADPEASEVGQSLLSSSMSVGVSQPWPSNQDILLRDFRPVPPGPALTAEKKTDPTDLEPSVMISGSVPSTFEECPRISSDLHNGAMDSSIKPMYPAEGQPDISVAISPAPGHVSSINNERNMAVARPAQALEAQHEIDRSLLLAVVEGNLDDVESLIHGGARVNPHRVYERPPLHLAICKHDAPMTELLLQEGANCAQEWLSMPPIHQACKQMDGEIIQLLLDAGASASSLNARKEQPLHMVLSRRFPTSNASDLIDLLISRGADINARTRAHKTPLHLSCEYDNVDNVQALLVRGANVNAQDRDGNTPFHTLVTGWLSRWSNSACFEAITRLLFKQGVNVNAQNKDGDTPLHTLVKESPRWRDWTVYLTVFQSLIKYGAQVNMQNMAGDTPLHILAKSRRSVIEDAEWKTQLIRALFDAGADLSVTNLKEESAWQLLG